MRRLLPVALLFATVTVQGQINTARVADDAMVVERVAEASKRDLPVDLLTRIVNEDIELLRGRRTDGSFQYAVWERLEASRTTESYTISPKGDKTQSVELRGESIYRVILDSPGRRLILAKNRPLLLERLSVEYIPTGGTTTKIHVVDINAQLIPGQSRVIDLPDVARQATIRVTARADEATGYGNINVSLVQAKIVDRSDSPYADAVASAKSLLKALENGDIPSTRAMAARIRDSVGSRRSVPTPAARTIEVTAPREASAESIELYTELQVIEDLLTGNDSERREGLDKLHQMVRRIRPR